MGKITVVCVKFDSNLGDYLLGDCLRLLIERQVNGCQVETVDLRARRSFDKPGKIRSYLSRFLKRIKYLFYGGEAKYLQSFYLKSFKDSDAVVFAGGGIVEYKHYSSSKFIKCAIDACNLLNKPIVFNAVGMLDRFDSNNPKSLELKNCLTSKNVEFIGVRENVGWMEEYVGESHPVQLVCDPACWAARLYDVEKNESSNVIGVGLIRPNIFLDYGIQCSPDDLIRIYDEAIEEFIKNGYRIEFFTNGTADDLLLYSGLMKRRKTLKKWRLREPKNAEDLVRMISGYRAVFSSRMHSAIVSYSLDIPCFTVCWAEKIRAFYSNVHCEEMCIDPLCFHKEDLSLFLKKGIFSFSNSALREKYLQTAIEAVDMYKGCFCVSGQ